ncbi:MAG: TIM barrel protein [Verrucomicrobiota bacterium]
MTSAIRHSACRWCYPEVSLEELCREGERIGLSAIDLVTPGEIPVLKQHGLECAIVTFPTGITPAGETVGGIERAFNRIDHHDTLAAVYEPWMQAAAAAGTDKVIVFSGNRDGLSDEAGLENCAAGLRRLLPLAEKLGITLVMELLNSKIDHPAYMCDHTAWGVELCERLGSPNFGLLYDIYHMQVMEGDVIRTIRENHRHIVHYHTGGVPGRNEIDESQELNYPAIMSAIADTGYCGFIGQEFLPTGNDPLSCLRRAVEICSV